MQQKMQWLEFSGTHLYSWPERSTVTVKGLVHGHNIAMRWSWIQLNIFQCIGICITTYRTPCNKIQQVCVANCSRLQKTIPKKIAWELKDSAKMICSISYEHTPLIEVSLLKLYMWTSTNLLWPQPAKYVWISLSRSFTFKASVWKQINM